MTTFLLSIFYLIYEGDFLFKSANIWQNYARILSLFFTHSVNIMAQFIQCSSVPFCFDIIRQFDSITMITYTMCVVHVAGMRLRASIQAWSIKIPAVQSRCRLLI